MSRWAGAWLLLPGRALKYHGRVCGAAAALDKSSCAFGAATRCEADNTWPEDKRNPSRSVTFDSGSFSAETRKDPSPVSSKCARLCRSRPLGTTTRVGPFELSALLLLLLLLPLSPPMLLLAAADAEERLTPPCE